MTAWTIVGFKYFHRRTEKNGTKNKTKTKNYVYIFLVLTVGTH